jgi:hypothetical protein
MISVLLHLGYGFVRATATLPFRAGRGKERFLRDFAPEGLVPATELARKHSAGFERCIGCGFCDLALDDDSSLADLSGSLWRAPETWPALEEALDRLVEADLERAEALCPTEVPLRHLVSSLREALTRWAEWKTEVLGGTGEVV